MVTSVKNSTIDDVIMPDFFKPTLSFISSKRSNYHKDAVKTSENRDCGSAEPFPLRQHLARHRA